MFTDLYTKNVKEDMKSKKDYANKLLFDLSDEEVKDLLLEFDTINENMEKIASIKGIEEVEPQHFPQELYTEVLREDSNSRNISTKDALSNSKGAIEDVVSVPKVVG